jgi:chromosome partitioning protein
MRWVVAVINLKGGVGKTTSAVNIAACFGEMGKKVLLIDIDPQGSASLSFGKDVDGRVLLDALQKTIALPYVPTNIPGVDIVPAGPELAAARKRFSGIIGERLLSGCLKWTNGSWDYVIIDCPPSLGILSMNALLASRYVLIPVEASFLGLTGLQQMMSIIDSVKGKNSDIELLSIIPCRTYPRRLLHQEIMDKLNEMFPGKVSPIVHENVSLAESPARGKPVILTSSHSRGADDYRLIALWLAERIGPD